MEISRWWSIGSILKLGEQMKVLLRPQFSKFMVSAVHEYLKLRPRCLCLDGDGPVAKIEDAIVMAIENIGVTLLFHRLPDLGVYARIELVDMGEVRALVRNEYNNETDVGVNILSADGSGGIVMHFDSRDMSGEVGRISIAAWGSLGVVLDPLQKVLSSSILYDEIR